MTSPVRIELQEYRDLGRCSSSTVKSWEHGGVCVMLGAGGRVGERKGVASVTFYTIGIEVFGAATFYTVLREILDKKMSEDSTTVAITALAMESALLDLGWVDLITRLVEARTNAAREAHLEGQEHARRFMRDWLFRDYNPDRDATEEYLREK